MTVFLRLISHDDKTSALQASCAGLRRGESTEDTFIVAPQAFSEMPGSAFAYWVDDRIRSIFGELRTFDGNGRAIRQGVGTSDDFRFARLWWEISETRLRTKWFTFAKGGGYATYYSDLPLVVNWEHGGAELRSFSRAYVRNDRYYFLQGLTWSDRTTKNFSARIWPREGVFSVKGSAGFFGEQIWLALALMNSAPFRLLISLLVGASDAAARSYQVGVIGLVPFPDVEETKREIADGLARRAQQSWLLTRALDETNESSHAFVLPLHLKRRLSDYDPARIAADLARIQGEIDSAAFELYGMSEAEDQRLDRELDRSQALTNADGDEDEQAECAVPTTSALLSWAVGVACGRFDWRIATGERPISPEPDPFDPLPGKSPAMLPEGANPFHGYAGILVDESGHPHDLVRLIEDVLTRVDVPVPEDVRRWLRRDFFAFHLQRYSKSRRKAPIYWPLATTSERYTLWIYYPRLTSQTLYTAINDLVEPKLQQVGSEVAVLRNKGAARTRDDERQFETLQAFELELIELRDTLLKLAATYKPNQDDGVQICAAPLWPLFRHKPWQKVLKDTWAKLEKGDYDWAQLAMNYWPERVREKCKMDKSLAIAHGLEHLYAEAEAQSKQSGRKKARGDE